MNPVSYWFWDESCQLLGDRFIMNPVSSWLGQILMNSQLLVLGQVHNESYQWLVLGQIHF